MLGHCSHDRAAGLIAQRERRREISQIERAELVAEWVRITGERQEVSAQVGPKPKGGRPEGGTREAARKLGMTRQTVERSLKVAALSPEAKEAPKGPDRLSPTVSGMVCFMAGREYRLVAFSVKTMTYGDKWQPVGESNPSFQVENLTS